MADTDSTRDVRSKDANTGDVNSDDTLGDSQHLERIQPLEKRALLRDVIYKTLLDLVRSGQYQPGDRLPRESQLASQLNVSRTPLREALQMLEADGYLVRQRGRGTFIKERIAAVETGLETLDSMTDVVRQHGFEPGTACTEIILEDADSTKAEALEIPEGSKVCTIKRLRTTDGEPLSWGWISTPRDLLPEIPAPEEVAGSVIHYLESKQVRITVALATISPVVADRKMAEVLRVKRGTPLLKLCQTHYRDDGKPVAVSETLYRSDVVRFKVIRRRR